MIILQVGVPRAAYDHWAFRSESDIHHTLVLIYHTFPVCQGIIREIGRDFDDYFAGRCSESSLRPLGMHLSSRNKTYLIMLTNVALEVPEPDGVPETSVLPAQHTIWLICQIFDLHLCKPQQRVFRTRVGGKARGACRRVPFE